MSQDKPEETQSAQACGKDALPRTLSAEHVATSSDVKVRWYPDHCFTELPFKQRSYDARYVLIPRPLHDQLMQEEKNADEEKERQVIAQANAEGLTGVSCPGPDDTVSQNSKIVGDAEGQGGDGNPSKSKASSQRRRRSVLEPISGRTHPTAFQRQLMEARTKDKLRVYGEEAVLQLIKGGQSVDSDVVKRNQGIADVLQKKGPFRRIGAPRRIGDVLALKFSHPHFGEVIDFVANHLELIKVSKHPVRIPPMLLAGPPGVGKTHFSDALAHVLGVPIRRHQMDQAESSSALMGSEMTWSNSRVGLVFDEIVMGDYANPVILLDELDKAPSDQAIRFNPVSILHSLLEPVSAARVRDLSVDMEIDASMITWIATCNYPWRVPLTLRTRLKEFFIGMPNAEQALMVARSVVGRALSDAGVAGFKRPGRDVIVALAPLSAREIYQVVIAAVATALKDRQRSIGIEHLPPELVADGSEMEGGNASRTRLH
jgi:ATP-dependent Lon protease